MPLTGGYTEFIDLEMTDAQACTVKADEKTFFFSTQTLTATS